MDLLILQFSLACEATHRETAAGMPPLDSALFYFHFICQLVKFGPHFSSKSLKVARELEERIDTFMSVQ